MKVHVSKNVSSSRKNVTESFLTSDLLANAVCPCGPVAQKEASLPNTRARVSGAHQGPCLPVSFQAEPPQPERNPRTISDLIQFTHRLFRLALQPWIAQVLMSQTRFHSHRSGVEVALPVRIKHLLITVVHRQPHFEVRREPDFGSRVNDENGRVYGPRFIEPDLRPIGIAEPGAS